MGDWYIVFVPHLQSELTIRLLMEIPVYKTMLKFFNCFLLKNLLVENLQNKTVFSFTIPDPPTLCRAVTKFCFICRSSHPLQTSYLLSESYQL